MKPLNINFMHKTLLFFATISLVAIQSAQATIWTINSGPGDSFSPSIITINFGDTVNFVIATAHDAREVSLTTWNANGNTALPGGFQTAFGGGMVLPAILGVGTHYYVCTPHADDEMKGTIIVQNPTGFAGNQSQTNVSIYPNPSNGQVQFAIGGSQITKNCKVEIYTMQGERIYQSVITNTKSDIDLSNPTNGIYFVKIYSENEVRTEKIIIQK